MRELLMHLVRMFLFFAAAALSAWHAWRWLGSFDAGAAVFWAFVAAYYLAKIFLLEAVPGPREPQG